jgi:hypothetical protein
MSIRHFTRDQLDEIGVPFELGDDDTCATELSDQLVASERWTEVHTLVFRAPDTGDAYQVDYEVGSTEQQDGIDPWHRYGKTIPAVEVEERPVVVQQWLPVDAPRDPGLDTVLPAWEAAAKGAAEAWLRSESEVTGRLEWVSQTPSDGHDQEAELIERHDDGIDTGPGITVRRRTQPAA